MRGRGLPGEEVSREGRGRQLGGGGRSRPRRPSAQARGPAVLWLAGRGSRTGRDGLGWRIGDRAGCPCEELCLPA